MQSTPVIHSRGPNAELPTTVVVSLNKLQSFTVTPTQATKEFLMPSNMIRLLRLTTMDSVQLYPQIYLFPPTEPYSHRRRTMQPNVG